jgi:hypothetical protein
MDNLEAVEAWRATLTEKSALRPRRIPQSAAGLPPKRRKPPRRAALRRVSTIELTRRSGAGDGDP